MAIKQTAARQGTMIILTPARSAWFRGEGPLTRALRDAEEGGFCAQALGHAIFTEAETWEDLRANVLEAVSVHFEDAPALAPR
ncbi:MAG TPA: hypothetical protein VGE89_01500 [Bryobacteraceae bacterium]|jgi:hypothetical protein